MSNIKNITIKKIQNEKLYNLAVLDDESYVANGVVVHNCRSTLVPITMYEQFTPTETIEVEDEDGEKKEVDINKFIDDNIGKGFSRYTCCEPKKENEFQSEIIEEKIVEKQKHEITDPGVDIKIELINDTTELYKYSKNGFLFKEITIVYKSNERIDGQYESVTHKDIE